MSKRQSQKLNTRKKIIETAFRVFSENGFNVPSSTIAKEAGVSHGLIFAHFPTVDNLVECLLEDFSKNIGESLHTLSESAFSIEEFLSRHLDVIEKYEPFYTRLILEKNLLPGNAKYTFAAIQSTAAYHFSRVIEREILKGTVKEMPIHMLFNTWAGLLHYYLINRDFFCPLNEPVIKRYGGELINTYLALIKKESGV
ncbi:MAG: TetR/AcrR family transcriptional regulator [Clostridiaceae bacterium]|nr:TetR/AcrR family transcriptional regulator [Clostridiaceae bacterium]